MTRVSTVIQSHLSDVIVEMETLSPTAKLRLSFVKQLLLEYPDTTTRISDKDLSDIWEYINK
jgi:hypothetical protein